MSEPTGEYAIATPCDIAAAARVPGGPSGLPLYGAAGVARQVERDHLNALIQAAEAEHGAISDDEVQALRDQLHHARAEQGGRVTGIKI
ncbi:CopG family transcriptional regulator [Streptomyces varsoviensis]|uniref:CopG family transcriptional regulator n=1 Tax=Streptomyces varsoviensis TaxID=67373 RepID=UPI0034074025